MAVADDGCGRERMPSHGSLRSHEWVVLILVSDSGCGGERQRF